MKNLKNTLLIFPSLPFLIIIAIYLFYNLVKENGITEVYIKLQNDGTLLTKELKDFVLKIYPRYIIIIVSIIFWTALLIKTLIS